MRRLNTILILASLFLLVSCNQKENETQSSPDWKQELQRQLPLLGHRNWILVGEHMGLAP